MLTGFQVRVDIGIGTGVVVFFLAFVFLVHLLTAQPFEEIGNLLVVYREVEVLRQALEASEASVAILGAIADIGAGTH